MSVYIPNYTICGKQYSLYQLLKLAGLHGIHPKFEYSDRIKYDIFITDENTNEEGAVITINSVSLIKLQVAIYPNQKIIRNNFFITYKSYKGLAYSRVNKQVEYATKFNFKILEICAQRDDNYQIEIGEKIHDRPLVGYLIWMKFGYLMDINQCKDFAAFLSLHKKDPSQTILDLIKIDYDFWQKKGYDWDGYFDLKNDSDSKLTLETYRPSSK